MKKITLIKNLLALVLMLCAFSMTSQERIGLIQDGNLLLLDTDNGDIIESSFIALNSGTPKALIQVEDEIWITYQLDDKIERYDLQGVLISSIETGLDNIRGLSIVNQTEVWVCNSGSNNGATANSIARFDFAGTNLGYISLAPESDSPFDVIDNGDGEVYISYSSSNNIERRDYSGAFIGNIVESGVVSFVQQIEREDSGTILAAVFSSINNGNGNGIYRFSETDGSIVNYFSLGSLRGVAKLGNGNILYSSGAGFGILDPVTGTATDMGGGSAQFFGRLNLGECVTPPTPTGDTAQTFVDGATLADIVVDPTDVFWFATEVDAMNNTNPLPLTTLLENGTTYYAVSIVDECLSEPFAVTVTVTLGIGDFNNANFKFYPNPTSGIFTITNSEIISEISVTNMLGQTVYSKRTQSAEVTLDLSTLTNGTYLVKVNTDGIINTVRIIKQ